MFKFESRKINTDCIAVILIFVGEICFYTMPTLLLYLLMTGLGTAMGIWNNINRFTFKVKKNNFIVWLTLIWLLYFFYGCFYLQKGNFNWDTLGWRYFEIIGLYLAISDLFVRNERKLESAFMITGSISVLYLLYTEWENILAGSIRIGDALSGNVNTVGYNFGLLSTFSIWFYCREKKLTRLLFFLLFTAVALATGSKKVLMMMAINVFIYFWYEKNTLGGWIKVLLFIAIATYLIFGVPYLYHIIGERTINMFKTMMYGGSSEWYSHSTEVREAMLQEAIELFKTKPLFGGGWNYFYAHTVYEYDYSHCNYTEMLCTFGILGTALFYVRYLDAAKFAFERRKVKEIKDHIILVCALIVDALLLDWAAVTFSAQCVWYFPLIICASIIYTAQFNEEKRDKAFT